MQLNLTLPTFSEATDKQNAEKIRGYLATLHDQLRYMMLNIDTDNLSDGLSQTITNASETAERSKESIIKLEDKISAVTQTAEKIHWLISDGTDSADFTLTGYAARLIAESINLKGYVSITDLEESGTTKIHGGNIIAGTISADKLSVSDLSALSASIGGWTVTDAAIYSSVIGRGSLYLNSPLSSDGYWLRALDANGYTTFYIAKNGACYFNGGYLSNGSVASSKLATDGQSRLDLINNYYGVKVGRELSIATERATRRIYVNEGGILTFDSGGGNTPFSFALDREGTVYTLKVLNGSGQTVGSFTLS